MESKFNMRSPAVKRLMREAEELRAATSEYSAQPLDDNLFEWHFTFRGPEDSEFTEGIYHGRILLPAEYPMRPPSIIMLTPNGRFETCRKICLSISGHHPESWQPSWSIRTALLAIIGFMPSPGKGAIGSLDYTSDERRTLARKSQDWKCSSCGCIQSLVMPRSKEGQSQKDKAEVQELANQIVFKEEEASPKPKYVESSNETPVEEQRVNVEEENLTENARRRTTVHEEAEEEEADVAPDSNDQREHAGPAYNLVVFLLSATIAFLLLRRILCLTYLPDLNSSLD